MTKDELDNLRYCAELPLDLLRQHFDNVITDVKFHFDRDVDGAKIDDVAVIDNNDVTSALDRRIGPYVYSHADQWLHGLLQFTIGKNAPIVVPLSVQIRDNKLMARVANRTPIHRLVPEPPEALILDLREELLAKLRTRAQP